MYDDVCIGDDVIVYVGVEWCMYFGCVVFDFGEEFD